MGTAGGRFHKKQLEGTGLRGIHQVIGEINCILSIESLPPINNHRDIDWAFQMSIARLKVLSYNPKDLVVFYFNQYRVLECVKDAFGEPGEDAEHPDTQPRFMQYAQEEHDLNLVLELFSLESLKRGMNKHEFDAHMHSGKAGLKKYAAVNHFAGVRLKTRRRCFESLQDHINRLVPNACKRLALPGNPDPERFCGLRRLQTHINSLKESGHDTSKLATWWKGLNERSIEDFLLAVLGEEEDYQGA